jgi:DNA-directed RNA polymerase subunit H
MKLIYSTYNTHPSDYRLTMSLTNHSTDVVAVFMSRQTILDQMSQKHGYDISEYTGFSHADIDSMMSVPGQLDMMFDHTLKTETDVDNADGVATKQTRVPAKSRIYVRYLMHPSLNRTQIKNIINDAFVHGTFTGTAASSVATVSATPLQSKDTLIVVAVGGSTGGDAVTQDLVFRWNTSKQYVVVHDVRNLKFNVLNHDLQPSDIHIATPEEQETLLNKYKLTPDQLPEIGRFDPVVKVLCARPGQIVCFLRKSPTAVNTWYYRIVVD